MVDKKVLELTPFQAVVILTDRYKFYWQDKSNWYWVWMIFLEFIELIGALLHVHKDPPKWELIQIASMCLNFMYKISDGEKQ